MTCKFIQIHELYMCNKMKRKLKIAAQQQREKCEGKMKSDVKMVR